MVMSNSSDSADNLIFVEPSPIARRLLWHLLSIGSRRLTRPDRHESFEKPGAHLFWVESIEGELEHETGRFAMRRGRKVGLVDIVKPRTYIPAPKRHLTIAGSRFGGPALEFWHEEIRGNEIPNSRSTTLGSCGRRKMNCSASGDENPPAGNGRCMS